MEKEKIDLILEKHKKWLMDMKDGSRADLSGANLYCADLSRADLSRADLSGANLSGANLYCADLSRADLSGANLSRANLSGANLSGANLYCADLSRADLSRAKIDANILNKYVPICCPEYGEFIGWKKANGKIVKLKITEDAKRCSAFGRKCRCSKAIVLDIENMDGTRPESTSVPSDRDKRFMYRIGETVEVTDFDDDRKNECSTGIHFFITRQEAVNYN